MQLQIVLIFIHHVHLSVICLAYFESYRLCSFFVQMYVHMSINKLYSRLSVSLVRTRKSRSAAVSNLKFGRNRTGVNDIPIFWQKDHRLGAIDQDVIVKQSIVVANLLLICLLLKADTPNVVKPAYYPRCHGFNSVTGRRSR